MSNYSNNVSKSSDDLIFEYIYVTSMRDATLQLSYGGKKAWLTKSEYFCSNNSWFKGLHQFVDSILDNEFESQIDYDNKLIELAKDICNSINNDAKNKWGTRQEGHFTFGNAQKLINMIIKNYYICTYKNTELKDGFKYCHCPMDSQLLLNVWKKRDNLEIQLGKRDDFLKSWGKEDFENDYYPDRYKKFQNAVKELSGQNISRLEYDFKEWNNN